MKKFSEFRRKDYQTPRSLKEAFGFDDSFEPEIRCMSERWQIRKSRPVFPTFVLLFSLAAIVWLVVQMFAH